MHKQFNPSETKEYVNDCCQKTLSHRCNAYSDQVSFEKYEKTMDFHLENQISRTNEYDIDFIKRVDDVRNQKICYTGELIRLLRKNWTVC